MRPPRGGRVSTRFQPQGMPSAARREEIQQIEKLRPVIEAGPYMDAHKNFDVAPDCGR